MKQATIAIATLAVLVGGTASAQESYYWPAPTRVVDAARTTEFPIGTPLATITRTEVNTKQMKPGDRVYLEVAGASPIADRSSSPSARQSSPR